MGTQPYLLGRETGQRVTESKTPRDDPAPLLEGATMVKYDALAQRITHWMLSNPGKPLVRCARELNVSANYIYYFVSTDTFQAKYNELCGKDFKEAFVTTLAERLRTGASVAVDKVIEQMELSPSAEYILDAGELLINAAVRMDGPRPGAQAAVQINNYPQIPQDVLATVQQQMLSGVSTRVLPAGETVSNPPADSIGSVIHDGDAGLSAAR